MWIITLKADFHQEEKGERSVPAGIKEILHWHLDKNGYFAATFSDFLPTPVEKFYPL